MLDSFKKVYRYVKGVYEAACYDPATRDLLYYDNKITENNFATSVNMGELTAGVGNPTVIQLPDTAKINLTLTAQDVDLRARQLQTGGTLGWNGIVDTCELITAAGSTISVTGNAVAPYGSDVVCAYIDGDGTAYTVGAGGIINGFTATSGKTYAVRYYVAGASNEVLNIRTLFEPQIVTLEVKMPVYAVPEGSGTMQGTRVGTWRYIIPRFIFNGDASLNVNNTTAGTTGLSGQALSYDSGEAATCQQGTTSSLAYMVYEPIDQETGITGIVTIGGNDFTVAESETIAITPYFVMNGSELALADTSRLTFTSSDQTKATVIGNVVTGVAAGDCEVEISLTGSSTVRPYYVNVEVTA